MSLSQLSAIAEIVSAVAVVVTLIYLSRQVRQGNLLARAQTRQWMIEQAHTELYRWMDDPVLHASIVKPGPLTADEQCKLHYFLIAAMRQREWEWFQGRDKVVSEDVKNSNLAVLGLHLGTERTRNWWRKVGHVGFHPEFVAEVNAYLEGWPTHTYFEDVLTYEDPPPAKKPTRRRSA